MYGIAHWIEKRARLNPECVAVITEQEQLTYKALQEQIERVGSYLVYEKKVKKGDRIAILSQNRLEYIVLLFAIAKLECIAVPLNIRLSVPELVYQLNDSEATLLMAEESFQETTQKLVKDTSLPILPIDQLSDLEYEKELKTEKLDVHKPYIICYTSGTTGKPKGAVLTQDNMYWNAINNLLEIGLTAKDRSIVLLPLFHIGGIGLFAFPTLFSGGAIIIPGKFDPSKAIAMIEKHQATVVMGVPSIHQALFDSPEFESAAFQSVRWFYSGGAPCPIELIKAFTDKGYLFGQGFGLTETSPTVFLISEEDAKRKMGSVGKPVMFCEFRLIDAKGADVETGEVGHLIVRGPNVFKEYWRRAEATKEALKDGWFHTGDLAKIDEEGFVYIVGRKKEMIISGGENIYPLEVEQVIQKLTEVSEVAVIGKNDAKWGEVPAAFVVKRKGTFLTKEQVVMHCQTFLAKYKVPKEVHFLEELPKNATGKIQKNKLIEQVREYDKV